VKFFVLSKSLTIQPNGSTLAPKRPVAIHPRIDRDGRKCLYRHFVASLRHQPIVPIESFSFESLCLVPYNPAHLPGYCGSCGAVMEQSCPPCCTTCQANATSWRGSILMVLGAIALIFLYLVLHAKFQGTEVPPPLVCGGGGFLFRLEAKGIRHWRPS
jgi:hypothetical protein